jgi:flagellar biogenesis protein FliO
MAAACALLLGTTAAGREDNGATANGPAALPGSPASLSHVAPGAAKDADADTHAAAPPNQTTRTDAPTGMDAPADRAASWSPPASEGTALGVAADPPRSAAGEAAAGAGPLAWLRRVDPRAAEMLRVGGALAVVLGILLLARVCLRRAAGGLGGGGRPSGVLEVLARYPIGRGHSLVLLKLSRRVILVHQTGAAMTTISEVTDADEVATLLGRMEAGSRSREAVKFRSALSHFESEHDRLTAQRDAPEIVDLTRGRRKVSA